MALHAKPSGAYTEGDQDWIDNVNALWQFASSLGYTLNAFSGMMGNAQHEGGMNPWRWEGDVYNVSNGYGLFQYTPGSGYLNTYGPMSQYYSPNHSTSSQSPGATPEDGLAQIEVIDASGKYLTGSLRVSLLTPYVPDCTNYSTINDFKSVDNIIKATYLWVGFFEFPGWWRTQTDVIGHMQPRLDSAQAVWDTIGGVTPTLRTILFGGARENIRRNIIRR